MFAFEPYGIVPDMVVLGKGLGGGVFPMAALIARAGLDLAGERALGHYTHEKSPVGSAAALAALDVIEEEKLLLRSKTLGERALARLKKMKQKCSSIADVRGIGLLLGIEMKNADLAESALYRCPSEGCRSRWGRATCWLAAPLIILRGGPGPRPRDRRTVPDLSSGRDVRGLAAALAHATWNAMIKSSARSARHDPGGVLRRAGHCAVHVFRLAAGPACLAVQSSPRWRSYRLLRRAGRCVPRRRLSHGYPIMRGLAAAHRQPARVLAGRVPTDGLGRLVLISAWCCRSASPAFRWHESRDSLAWALANAVIIAVTRWLTPPAADRRTARDHVCGCSR